MIDNIDLSKEQKKMLNQIFSSDNIDFCLGVADYDGFPEYDIPEICFAGRSNVGKSSLINALTGRKNLARASNTPGRTQELNYFSVGKDLHIVDLPGYGFAKAPKDKVGFWNKLIRDYLKGRVQLRRVFILIDSRHGIKKNDMDILKTLDKTGMPYQIILTKCDKISDKKCDVLLNKTKNDVKDLIACHQDIILTSAEKKIGIVHLRHEVAKFIKEYNHE